MAHIKAKANYTLYNGMSFTFKAPCDCTAADGLKVNDQTFEFKDSNGNSLTGHGNLFSEGAYIKAILDTDNGIAYLQNAGTNAYLEEAFEAVYEEIDGIFQVGDTLTTVRTDLGEDWLLCNGAPINASKYPELTALMPTDITDTNSYSHIGESIIGDGSEFTKGFYLDGYFYAASKTDSTILILKSSDMKTWETAAIVNDSSVADANALRAFKYLNGQFVIFATKGSLLTVQYSDSLDGPWASAVTTTGAFSSTYFTYCTGYYYMGMQNSLYRTDSLSAEEWTRVGSLDTSSNCTLHSLDSTGDLVYGKWIRSDYAAFIVYDPATNQIYKKNFRASAMNGNITYDHSSGTLLYAFTHNTASSSETGYFDKATHSFVSLSLTIPNQSPYDIAKVGDKYIISVGTSLCVISEADKSLLATIEGGASMESLHVSEDIRKQYPGAFLCPYNGNYLFMSAAFLPDISLGANTHTYIRAKA